MLLVVAGVRTLSRRIVRTQTILVMDESEGTLEQNDPQEKAQVDRANRRLLDTTKSGQGAEKISSWQLHDFHCHLEAENANSIQHRRVPLLCRAQQI